MGQRSIEQGPAALRIRNLTVAAASGRTIVQSLDLEVREGEMLALVGESGSGKSVTASAALGLLPKALRIAAGGIEWSGAALAGMTEREKRERRGKRIGYVFQNYQGSFTPFLTIGKQMTEIVRAHERCGRGEAQALAKAWLERVRLPAERTFRSYPFQLSGGQLQRASIATALMLKPALLIADEPTTALDAVTGRQILDLLRDLQRETGCAVLLITHDLSHAFGRADRIAVMYGGRLVETGTPERIERHPLHPYTQALLRASPRLDGDRPRRLETIPGDAGLVSERGCTFAARCHLATPACACVPERVEVDADHAVACHERLREGGARHDDGAASESDLQVVLV
ncbi:ABC transporter ATP-binding protein [Paenibacillus sp. TRM 82003]|nr:ABC transporter ATP-binding protein [Paenibacillus sp. TRM 82003]